MDRKNQKIDEIKQRILYFAESQNIRKGYLYEVIELSQSNFSGAGASSSLKSENLIKVLNVFPELNPEWLLLGTGEMLRKSSKNYVENSSGVAIMDGSPNSTINQDNRVITSDSPDVLRAQIDLLDERIKEKDAQIKEKDAQIKEKDAQIAKLLDILSKK